jgi:hypothetical protein
MISKPFKDWDSEEIERVFEIERLWELPLLQDWITLPQFSPKSDDSIEILKDKLLKNADAWNEDELKMFSLLNFINFEHLPYYKAFTQHTLSILTDTVESKGDVEFMVATGRKRPQQPFFFLHEYKQEEQRTNDALGQLLIGMVAAQLNNQDKLPLYGCYVLGRFWFFVVLAYNQYAVSNAYNAADNDIYAILEILKTAKNKIESRFDK